MLVKYYKDNDLKYASRKRFKDITKFTEIASERQQAILLGDGANTQVKTFSANICDYVTIDGTRWFVTSYEYLNGGQVRLNLQRDVIGEFGLDGCYGQVQRGFTNSILQNRKELSLNQILKKRTPLISQDDVYGNFTVNNHNKELWGILYLAKPTEIDPETGEIPTSVNVNIPSFTPKTIDYPFIEQNTRFLSEENPIVSFITIPLCISVTAGNYVTRSKYYWVRITYRLNGDYSVKVTENTNGNSYIVRYAIEYPFADADKVLNEGVANEYGIKVAQKLPDFYFRGVKALNLAQVNYTYNEKKYNDVVIKYNTHFYKYSSIEESVSSTGGSFDDAGFYSFSTSTFSFFDYENRTYRFRDYNSDGQIIKNMNSRYNVLTNSYRELTPSEAGDITIRLDKTFTDEPYYLLAFPLYDVIITGNEDEFDVGKEQAFVIFNTIIQYLSGGSNPYLVDAQIYPYCPELTSVASRIQNYPFFEIESTSYDRNCKIILNQNINIKKEYIEKIYSIVSPEKTGKFDFNFYDYTNDNSENKQLQVVIKTALKPFSVISSAVLIPEEDSLMGITYNSDLRGCQPSSNGFECSLSTNAYQQYLRENSNYQQIFALQKEELQMQHQVERVNEKTQAVVNTVTATGMGAIGGANIGSAFGPIAGAVGAAVGGTVAGATVGTAMAIQYNQNEKLRQYEERLQQQTFDLEIGTIKNLPNSISRISSFNEIILKDFYYVVETYECSDYEKELVDKFIEKYGYGLGVYGFYRDFFNEGWFLRGTLITSTLAVNLHNIAENEFNGGIYYYEQE